MVETGAGGFHRTDYSEFAEDLIPAEDDTYDLGATDKRWAYLFAVIAILTSLTIGGIYLGATTEGWLFVNASTQMNGSLAVNGSGLFWEDLTAYGTNVSFPNANVTASYFIGDGSQLHGIQHGNLVLFLINNASDITGSKILFTDIGVPVPVTLSKGITATGTEYQNWTTNDGVPNLHILVDGVNELHFHARVTAVGTKDTTIFWRLWQNDTSGNMNILFSSEESTILTTAFTDYDAHIATDERDLNLSDRLTLQLIVNLAGSGANPTVELKIEGDTDSRVELVIPGANVGTFVPYLGAIRNLDLGSYNLTAAYLFGDGSQLTGVSLTESDPFWSANFTLYNSTWSSRTNTSYYLATNPFGFYNITSFPDNYLLNTGDTATGNYTFDTDTLFIDSVSDRVGIGMTNPSEKLDVAGAIKASSTIYGNRADRFAFYTISGGIYASGSVDNYFAGNVGIGDSTPGSKLEVTGNITLSDANNCIIFNSGGRICSA